MSEQSKFIVIIRPEFMTFCSDGCRSAAFNHLLFRLAGKCKDQPKEKIQNGEILWYATTELLVKEMSDAWKVCKVRQEVNGLVAAGLIGRTSNPSWGQDRTKHFYFGQEQCARFVELCEQQHICVVHLDLPPEVKHLIYSSNANDKSIKCSCPDGANDESIGCKLYIHPMHSINSSLAFDKSIEALTKNTTKIDTKNNNEDKEITENASNDAPPRALVFHPEHPFIGFDDLLAPSLMVVRLTPNFPSRYWSEMEDKRRHAIVDEVMHYLQQRGIEVTIKWEYETEQEIEQILNENEKRSQRVAPMDDVDNHHTSHPIQEDALPQVPAIALQSSSLPLTVQEASVNGTLPKIEAHSQIEASPIALETTQPTRRGKKPDLSPVLPPARPDPAMEWGVEKCLAWGDYVRQSTLRPSTRSNSNYDKALQAARRIVGRGITENMFLIIWLNWMKGLGMDLQPLPEPALMSETWPNYSTDLWICDEHFEAEAAKYKRKKAERETQAGERKTEQQATVQIAAGVVQTVTYQESPLERHNRELREKFMGTGRKVG